jgi:hypothetical protein
MAELDGQNDRPVNDNAASDRGVGDEQNDRPTHQPSNDDAARVIRRAILAQLRRGASFCADRTETPYQARERFARLCEVARNVDRLATAGVILLRGPL